MHMPGPAGKLAHVELKLGDSIIMLSDEMPNNVVRAPQTVGGTTAGIVLYVDDVESLSAS
jgi:PhnB protein